MLGGATLGNGKQISKGVSGKGGNKLAGQFTHASQKEIQNRANENEIDFNRHHFHQNGS